MFCIFQHGGADAATFGASTHEGGGGGGGPAPLPGVAPPHILEGVTNYDYRKILYPHSAGSENNFRKGLQHLLILYGILEF